jgi:hypothetical protein
MPDTDPDHYGGAPVGPAIATQSAPALTEGRAVRLSVDLDGNLRTTGGGGGGGGTSSTFGDAFPADGTAIGVERGGNMVALVEGQAVMASSVPVVIASDQSTVPVSGSLTTTPVYSHTVNQGGLTTVTTDARLLAQLLTRVGYEIQNVSLATIYILHGSGTCSATNFTYALPPCGPVLDGFSPPQIRNQWQGEVRFCASTGTGKVSYAEYI